MQTDAELLESYRAGDRDAFTALFQRYKGPLTTYAWRLCGREEEAEEMVIEAFLRLSQDPPDARGSVRSWLYTVVHRQCLDRLRWRTRWGRLWEPLQRWIGPTPTPEELLGGSQEQRQLHAALAKIPEAHRAVLLLYYGEELPSKEVAEILGIEDHQVRSRLSYARRLLRQALGEDAP